jgi:hypothetical protein
VVGSSEHGNEPSGKKKGGKFLDQLREYSQEGSGSMTLYEVYLTWPDMQYWFNKTNISAVLSIVKLW